MDVFNLENGQGVVPVREYQWVWQCQHHIMRHTILFSSSVNLCLRLANCWIGVGVVLDTLCIFVLLLVEVSANANVLMHLMHCIVPLLWVIAHTSRALVVGGVFKICRWRGGTVVSPEVCREWYLLVYPLHPVIVRCTPLACTVPELQSNLQYDSTGSSKIQPRWLLAWMLDADPTF